MIQPPERSPERDAAIVAALPNVPFDGWTVTAVRRGLMSVGGDPEDATLLFPGSPTDMIEAFSDWADREMEKAAAGADMAGMRLPQRVRAVIALRLAQQRPYKEAVRRAIAVLSLPPQARLAAACTARTVDAVWHAAGDRAADFSWYTKRAILAGIYSATVLYWLRDVSEDDADTLAFLDRRLADLARFGSARRRVQATLERVIPQGLRARFGTA